MNSSRVNLQHRPFLTPIWVTAGAAGAAFLFALFMIWVWGTAGSTTVIVIADDPAAGPARTALLARMFGATQGPGRLNAIYASSPQSRQSVSAVAAQLHIAMAEASDTDARALAHRALREHHGERILLVAQSDMFPRVVEALSGISNVPQLTLGDYGVVYVVTVPRIGHANLLRLNY